MSLPARVEKRPEIVGRYALYGEIASGGMATVHFGRLLGPVGFSRPVAIKRLHPHCAKDPQFTKMFIDEARLASRIHHPNVVSTLDVVATEGELLLVMDYVQGESLARLLRKAMDRAVEIPLRVTLSIMCGVLHGLHAAHEAKSEAGEPLEIVHRDVSPQNVIVGIDGTARVLDFGIAHASARLETTQEGHIKGKVTYMAPEQLAGNDVDRRADIYSAGVMLWELFAGKRLFTKADAHTVLMDKMFKPVERPSLHREDIPDALDAVTLHALEKDPNRRFATAREMALALEKYGPLATPSEVGAWVEATARDALSMRSMKVAEFESAPPVCFDADGSGTPSSGYPAAAEVSESGSGVRRSDQPPGTHRGTKVMKSDKYPVTSRPSDRATMVDVPPARPTRVSMRASMIGLEVAKFYGNGRAKKALALSACVGVLGFLGLALGSFSSSGEKKRAADATASSTTGDTPAAQKATPLPAVLPPVTTCPNGMVGVPGGKYFMGFDDGLAIEKPAHQVSVASFCVEQFEVTVEKYKACSDHGDCKRAFTSNDGEGATAAGTKSFDAACNANDDAQSLAFPWRQHQTEKRGKHPINCVSWDMADAYCHSIDARLPTEAEWEYAARGSDGRRFPWGDDPPGPRLLNACGRECAEFGKKTKLDLVAMYEADDGWATTAPVGSFPRGRSRYGAEDMVGNVSEWVADWYGAYPADGEADPRGPTGGKAKVVRGGGWTSSQAAPLRPTFRGREQPDRRSYAIGFRCARTL